MQLDDNEMSIKCELNGRTYYLICEKLSLLGELFDAVTMFKNHVIKHMQDAPIEEPKVEE
jgi:hypothetical protein